MRWLVRVYIFRSREWKAKDIFRFGQFEIQKRTERAKVSPRIT